MKYGVIMNKSRQGRSTSKGSKNTIVRQVNQGAMQANTGQAVRIGRVMAQSAGWAIRYAASFRSIL